MLVTSPLGGDVKHRAAAAVVLLGNTGTISREWLINMPPRRRMERHLHGAPNVNSGIRIGLSVPRRRRSRWDDTEET